MRLRNDIQIRLFLGHRVRIKIVWSLSAASSDNEVLGPTQITRMEKLYASKASARKY